MVSGGACDRSRPWISRCGVPEPADLYHRRFALENLTHTLLGAAIGDAIAAPDQRERGRLRIAGAIAGNFPDVDLLYSNILPAPLGYLLHHRGHTHTLLFILAAVALAALILRGMSRRSLDAGAWRMIAVIGLGMLSHLGADGLNSYGVHPFYPVDNSWYYGDAVYIYEPWAWVTLGVPVALSSVRPAVRWGVLVALTAILLAAGMLHMVQAGAALPVIGAGIGLTLWLRGRDRTFRGRVALVAAASFVVVSIALREVARAELRSSAPIPQRIAEVMNPAPANPLCWSTITESRAGAGSVIYTGRMVDLGRRVGLAACAHHPEGDRRSFVLHQSLRELSAAAATDCEVSAWLRFARVPVVDGSTLFDARYSTSGRGNFTAMTLVPGRGCPGYIPPWKQRWGIPFNE